MCHMSFEGLLHISPFILQFTGNCYLLRTGKGVKISLHLFPVARLSDYLPEFLVICVVKTRKIHDLRKTVYSLREQRWFHDSTLWRTTTRLVLGGILAGNSHGK